MLLRDLQKNFSRQLVYLKVNGRRNNAILLFSLFILALYSYSWVTIVPSERIQVSRQDHGFQRNKTYAYYEDKIQLLIEPSQEPCAKYEEIQMIVFVASAPDNIEYREAIRKTWAKYQKAYFLMGLNGDDTEMQLENHRLEAIDNDDLIVYDFIDNYKNSTLKTALMMEWTLQRCPQAEFFVKTLDDTLLNPWNLRTLLVNYHGSDLLGYTYKRQLVFSDEYSLGLNWIYNVDLVPMYLAGSAYVINGKHLDKILQKACEAPLINLEDIYFTYIVAHKGLNLTFRHIWQLNPKRPLFHIPCVYWTLVSTNNYVPEEMVAAWSSIVSQDRTPCSPFLTYVLKSEWLLF